MKFKNIKVGMKVQHKATGEVYVVSKYHQENKNEYECYDVFLYKGGKIHPLCEDTIVNCKDDSFNAKNYRKYKEPQS